MTVSVTNSGGGQTCQVKQQTRLTSVEEKWSENGALSSTCLRSASDALSFRSRYLRYAAVIFCVLAMSIANIGMAWGTDYYLRYMKSMPAGNYDGNTSQKLTRFGSTNRYYCELSLSGSSSYGFFIRVDNSSTNCWKANATASTNQEIELYSYSGEHGNSNHRVSYTTGSAGTYIFTYDIENHKISVSPKSSQTVKVAWSIASGHDGDYNLGTYTTLSQEGSSSLYSADVDLTAVKHYMFVQTDNNRYWKNTATMSAGTYAYVYDYGTNNYGDSGNKNNFTPSAAGKYRFTWDHDAKMVKYERLYKVTYYGNGNTGGTAPSAAYEQSGRTVTASDNTGLLVKTGKVFAGWATSSARASSLTIDYAPGATITMSSADVDLYAVWTNGSYFISLTGKSTNGVKNTTDFYSSNNLTNTATEVNGVTFSKSYYCTSGNQTSIKGQYSNANRFIVYDTKSTSTLIRAYVKNTHSSTAIVYYYTAKEGSTSETDQSVTLASGEEKVISFDASNSKGTRVIFSDGNYSNIRFTQIIAIEKGTTLPLPGKTNYELAFPGRVASHFPDINGIEVRGEQSNLKWNTTPEFRMINGSDKYIKFTTTAATQLNVKIQSGSGFYVCTDNNNPSTTGFLTSGSSAGTKTINLDAANTYYIMGENSSNTKIDKVSFAAHVACTAPTSLAASNVGATTATLTVADGSTRNYEFYVSTSNTAPTASSVATHSVDANKIYNLTGLSPSTTYYAWVRAKADYFNKSTWVALTGSSFATDAAGCLAPAAPTISGTASYIVGGTISLSASCASGADASTMYTWYKGSDWATAKAAGALKDAATEASGGTTYSKASIAVGDAGNYWCEASNGAGCNAHNSSAKAVTVVYQVTYNANGGTGEIANSTGTSITLSNGTGFTAPSGYSFDGWNTAADGSGTGYTSGQTSITANLALYARWKQTVTLDDNGGSKDGSVVAYYNGAGPLATPTAPVYSGYSVYDYRTSDGTVVLTSAGAYAASNVSDGSSVAYITSSKWVHSGSTTLYAHWKVDAPSVSVSQNVVTMTATTGASIRYTTDGSTPTGSSTLYDSSNKPVIAANTTFNAIAIKAGCENSTVTTQACAYSPRIIYNANLTGTTGSTAEAFATENAKACGFSRANYKFKWWNTAANGTGEDFYVGESVTLSSSDVNLYAQWDTTATGQAFWVGDVAISSANTAYDVAGNSATMQIKRETNADWNSDISQSYNQVSKYSGTAKKAKVLAVDANDSYIEVNFKDGSAINALELGVCNKDGNDNEMVVIYSTTADFSSGVGEKVALNTKKFDQSTKAVYDVSPTTTDLYKYARIYRKVGTAVYGLTGGSEHIIRIYSIKAEKGAACESLDAPTGLTCSAQTKNSLTFDWNAVSHASSYDVYLYSDADCTAAVTPTEGKPYNVTGTSATLTGLDGGTTYYCKVRTKGNGSTYCTNGAITTTAASGKTKYGVTYSKGSATSGTAPTDGNSYAVDAEVTVKDTTGCKFVYASHTFRGWTDGTTFYKVGQTFRMPNENVTLTAVWDSYSAGSTTVSIFDGAVDETNAKSSDRYDPSHKEYYTNATTGFQYKTSGIKDELIDVSTPTSYTNRGSYVKAIRMNGSGGSNYIELKMPTGYTAKLFVAYSGYSSTNQKFGVHTSTGTTPNGSNCDTWNATASDGTTVYTATIDLSANTTYYLSGGGSSCLFEEVKVTLTPVGGGGGSGSWTNKYVAFGTNEGVVGTPTLPDTIWGVPSGKKIVQPADPTATGYIFDNWYPTQACNTAAFDWSGTITKDTTIYAKFNAPTTLIQQPAKVAGKRVPMDTLDAYRHPEIDSVIVHQLIDPAPYGTCNISYKLCYSNHVQLDEQPVIHYGTGAGVGYDTVWMPMEQIQKYELVAYLRTGAIRGEGDLVTTDTAVVSVENRWPIKVRYMKDGVELREPTQWYAYPSFKTTEAIRIPAERNGYILDSLEYGVGITVDSAKYIDYIGSRMYQVYLRSENASTVTAHYKVAPNTVYFFDTFKDPWYTPYIFDYGTTGYWDAGLGAGANEHLGTHATRIDFMERMYMMPIGESTTKLAIGSDEQKDDKGKGFDHFYSRTYTPEGWDHSITVTPEIFYRTDFNQALPMFVPVVKSTSDYYTENSAKARYFRGFWVKYSPDRDSTGYYLKVYDQVEVAGATLIQSIPMTLAPTGEDGTWELTATMDLEGGKTYGFKYTKATGASTVDWYGNAGTMNSTNHTDWLFTTGTNNCGLTTTSAGDYTFHLHCVNYGAKAANTATDSEVQGKMVMTVDYATNNGDYRVVYVDDAQTNLTVGKSNVEPIASQTIRARENGQDTVTFYIRKDATNRSMKFQKFNAGAWSDVAGGTIALTNTTGQTFTVSTDTTYQIYIQQNADGTSVEATGMDYYSGLYYIRTDCVDEHKWDYKQSMEAHSMVESDYASHLTTDPFTHYFVHWVDGNKNVKFVVATQYSPTLTDTLITDAYANVAGGNLPSAGASVRFMYNKSTNAIKRAYLAGAQGGLLNPNFLKLTETSSGKMKNTSGSAISNITFSDLGNFTYQAEIKAQPGLEGKLTAEYNSQTQYFKGSAVSSETILGGTGESWQNIVMTYDFKTNRLICAWTPGDTIDESMSINADIMIIRRGQRDAEQIVFKTNETKLTDVKYVYGVIQLDYNDLVGMMYSWDYWAYEHCMYYISFPFDVAVNDITGVGSIGKEWRIQRYNGAKRAEKGWFAGDGVTTFWEDVHAGDTLHAYEGYSLLLNRVRFNDSRNAIWENKSNGSSVYLFFPSLNATTGIVADGKVTVKVPSHLCTIDRNFINQNGLEVNHKNTDSHWNMMGTPLFENKTAFSIADNPIDPENPSSENIKYIYAWNSAGNTLGIRMTMDIEWQFKTMYSYMVQYAGDVVFKGSTINKSVAARRTSDSKNYHVNLELTKDELFVGRTYVELRENAVDSFLLNEDVYMVKNGVNADLYTYAGGYELGANVLTMDNHIIPVGIDVQKAGTYTFSMPSNFSGTVTLIDNFTQTRTNLAVDDYEIALPKGTINDRFELEININKMPTAIDGVDANQGALKDGKAHKFIENDMMYILKDGVLYDARGNRVK